MNLGVCAFDRIKSSLLHITLQLRSRHNLTTAIRIFVILRGPNLDLVYLWFRALKTLRLFTLEVGKVTTCKGTLNVAYRRREIPWHAGQLLVCVQGCGWPSEHRQNNICFQSHARCFCWSTTLKVTAKKPISIRKLCMRMRRMWKEMRLNVEQVTLLIVTHKYEV